MQGSFCHSPSFVPWALQAWSVGVGPRHSSPHLTISVHTHDEVVPHGTCLAKLIGVTIMHHVIAVRTNRAVRSRTDLDRKPGGLVQDTALEALWGALLGATKPIPWILGLQRESWFSVVHTLDTGLRAGLS